MEIQDFFARVSPPGAPQHFPTLAGDRWQENHLTGSPVDVIAQKSDAGLNCFYAPASFTVSGVMVAGSNTTQVGRKADLVSQLKALWLDIDCDHPSALKPRGGDSYPSIADGAKAFKEFCNGTKLPAPTIIVNSGGGLHIYWTFSESISRDRWQRMAAALVKAAEGARFKIDAQVTTNAAAVLRVVNTLNYKYDPPEIVTVLGKRDHDLPVEEMERALGPWLGMAHGGDLGAAAANAALGSGMAERVYDDMFMGPVTKKCGVMKYTLDTGGKDLDYHAWKNTVHVAAFAKDGDDWYHRLANQHPGYDPNITRAKYEDSVASKAQGIKPTLCTTLAGLNQRFNELCAACPHAALVNTPINLGAKGLALPPGFYRDAGAIWATAKDDKEAMRVVDNDVIDVNLRWDDDGGEVLDLMLDNKRVATFPLGCLGGSLTATSTPAAEQGMMVNTQARKKFQELLMGWVRQLQKAKAKHTELIPAYGWSKEKDTFSYAGVAYHGDTEDRATRPDAGILEVYAARGKLKPWQDAAHFVLEDERPEMAALLASAFAAPLVPLTGLSGMVLSAVSTKSGVGKTSAMQVAQAVWGDPISGMQSLNDTTNSVAKKMGQLRNLPVYWDELRMAGDVKAMVQFMFQLGQGKEKTRLNTNTDFKHVAKWSTMLTVGSNLSLMNHMRGETQDTDAGVVRVFEMNITKDADQSKLLRAQELFGGIQDNYGRAGIIYSKYVAKHHAMLEDTIKITRQGLGERVDHRQEERFWLALVTALLVGAGAARAAGLVQFDIASLREYLISTYLKMRTSTHNHSGADGDTFSTFLGNTAGNRLVTDKFSFRQTKVIPLQRPRLDDVWAHVSVEDRKVRVSLSGLSQWCRRHGRERAAVEQSFTRDMGATEIRTALGAGTEFSGGRVRCLEIDLISPEYDDLFATWGVNFSDGSSHVPGS